jgi:large subunit ribosomal protein L10
MKKSDKSVVIDTLVNDLEKNPNFYVTDIGDLTVETTSRLRRLCYKKGISLKVVKNTLLKTAMERSGKDYSELYSVLKGSTSIMLAESGSEPAKLIKEFRKSSPKPILKAAYIEESAYIGDDQLDALINIKSKNDLIADLVALLQSPAKNVVGALQSGGQKLSGIVKTLSEKAEN